MVPDRRDLHQPDLSGEWLSRGTGEEVPLSEATEFDIIPRLIGSRFLIDDNLRRRVHFNGHHMGPFLAIEETYRILAIQELESGDLEAALDAYKRALHHGKGWLGFIAMMGNHAALNSDELQKTNLGVRYRDLEDMLIYQIGNQGVVPSPADYAEFVRNIGRLEKTWWPFHQLFHMGQSTRDDAFELLEDPNSKAEFGLERDAIRSQLFEDIAIVKAPQTKDPIIGKKYLEICIEMSRFSEAVVIARDIGDLEAASKYEELAKEEPTDNPKFEEIFSVVLEESFPDC